MGHIFAKKDFKLSIGQPYDCEPYEYANDETEKKCKVNGYELTLGGIEFDLSSIIIEGSRGFSEIHGYAKGHSDSPNHKVIFGYADSGRVRFIKVGGRYYLVTPK